MKKFLKVLWFDKRDGYGIAVGTDGNEYYLSSDCCPADLNAKEEIQGTCYVLSGVWCCKDVKRVQA